jgi:NAD(P)-dependent dehydrogenase (short-subunit alcohol dehydrogenase family)
MPTYLITASTGIGAETARTLARNSSVPNSVRIFFCSLLPERCGTLRNDLFSLGACAEFLTGDLTDAAFPPRLVAACVERFGHLDALFNVAGISGRSFGDGPVDSCTEQGWQKTLEANLTTQYRMCREAIPIMLRQQPIHGLRGSVLNMSSILALHPEPLHFDTVAYAASKGGILSMTRTMAASYVRDKIRVNAVAPALVRTSMSARACEDESILEFLRRKQPLTEGVIPVEDVANVCAFLLTPLSRAITGQCLEIDAGWSHV